MLIVGTIAFILFLQDHQLFEAKHYPLFVMVGLAINLGIVSLTSAVQYGKGGPVQAIENLKIVWHVLITSIFMGDLPTIMEVLGCLSGIVGVTIIVLNK